MRTRISILLLIIAIVSAISCANKRDSDAPYIPYYPPFEQGAMEDAAAYSESKSGTAVLVMQNGEIIFEFNRAETVLVRVRVNSTEIIVWLVSGGSLKLKTEFVAPFEVLEQLLKGIIEWLHNLLRLNFTEMLRAMFHLRDELLNRSDLFELAHSDRQHLEGDILRVYNLLAYEWLFIIVWPFRQDS